MLYPNSLLFSLRRCSSSMTNRTFCRDLFYKPKQTRNCYKFLQSAKEGLHGPCTGSCASVRHLTSSVASPDDPNQECHPEIIQCLRNNGFPEEICSQIVAKLLPLRLDENQVNRTMSYWGACQFGHDRLVYLLTENPDLLLVDHQQIVSVFTFLSSRFSQNYVYKIILNCPQVLLEKHSQISSKLDLLNTTLGVPNSEIVNSSSLGHPLERIRVRYEFLKRCGVYKKAAAGVSTGNPSISETLDTSDEHFAKRVARLSPLEFEVFQNLFALEDNDDEDYLYEE